MTEIVLARSTSDYRSISALAHKIWSDHYTPIIGTEQVTYMLEKFQSVSAIENQIKKGFFYYLLQNNSKPVGYFAFQKQGASLFLSKLYVRSTARGKGIGKCAISFLEKRANEMGVSKIRLTVNRYNTLAIKAYIRMGFLIVEAIVQDIGNGYVMDDYVLEKKIGEHITKK